MRGPNGNGEEETATVGSLSYVLYVFGSERSAKDLTVLADQSGGRTTNELRAD